MPRVILLGPPGAGKGTQALSLAGHLGVVHIASGDLFRRYQEEDTDLGRLARSYMQRGELVPDDVTIRMALQTIGASAARGYILDGFPRTLEQAKALDDALARSGQHIDVVPLLEVSREELIRRLAGRWLCRSCQAPFHEATRPPRRSGVCDSCGGELYQRDDDRPDAVAKRLEVYGRQTQPLVDYYTEQGKLWHVNGEQGADRVAADLRDATAGITGCG